MSERLKNVLEVEDPHVLISAINDELERWRVAGFPHPEEPGAFVTSIIPLQAQLFGLTQLLCDKGIVTMEEATVAKQQWYLMKMYELYDGNIEAARRARVGLGPEPNIRPILGADGNPLGRNSDGG